MGSRTPQYDAVREPSFSTISDAVDWYDDNPLVFAAGAQWALDNLLRDVADNVPPGIIGDAAVQLIDRTAHRIQVHAAGGRGKFTAQP